MEICNPSINMNIGEFNQLEFNQDVGVITPSSSSSSFSSCSSSCSSSFSSSCSCSCSSSCSSSCSCSSFSSDSIINSKLMYSSLIKIRDLIKETFGDSFNEYWIDDPNLVPSSSLPCVCIAPISTEINIADTARDLYTHTIDVIVIVDAKQELKKFKNEVIGVQFLTEKMEEKTSAGALQENTILYILRNNLTLGANWAIGNIGAIDYATRIRGEVPSQFVVKEATCRLTITRIRTR